MNRVYVLALLGLAACGEQPGHAYQWAGNGFEGFDGDGKDIAESRLYYPLDLEFAPDGRPYVLDWNNHKIRRITTDNTFETVVGFFIGDGDEALKDLTAEGAPGLTVSLNHPTDLQFAPDGMLSIAAWHNHKLRTFDPKTGLVHVACGRGPGFKGDEGDSAKALFNQPKSIVRAPDGSLFILDQRNERIRKILPDGTIHTVAGKGERGFEGDGDEPLKAKFGFDNSASPQPSGALALDAQGNLYVSDGTNHRIRKIDFVAKKIETIAGTGEKGFTGDGGPALQATLNDPRDLEIGPDGRLYVADTSNSAVRAIDLKTGVITTVVGNGKAADASPECEDRQAKLPEADRGTPCGGEAGDEATKVSLNHPFGIAFDAAGTLYVADTFNNRILKVTR